MERTLLVILPLALAASLSPTGLLFETVILGGKGNARRNALFFVIGGTAFLAALGLLVMLVFKHTVIPSDHHRTLSAWIDIILGVAIIMAVAWSLLFKKEKKEKQRSRKRPYVVVGFFFMAINTSTNIPFVAASKNIADARLPLDEETFLFALLVMTTMWMMVLPLVLSYVAPEKSEVMLARARLFMQRHGGQLVRGFFVVVGVYLVAKGVRSLVS